MQGSVTWPSSWAQSALFTRVLFRDVSYFRRPLLSPQRRPAPGMSVLFCSGDAASLPTCNSARRSLVTGEGLCSSVFPS